MKNNFSDLIIELHAEENADPLHSFSHEKNKDCGFTVISSDSSDFSYRTIVTGNLCAARLETKQALSSLIGKTVDFYLSRRSINSGARFLVAGLGNPSVTSDSFGAKVAEKVIVDGDSFFSFVPQTASKTGLSTASMVRRAADEARADVIIAVDALAAREPHRLGNVIQISDHGIRPGSGVSEAKDEISASTMPCPVISVGIPTVIRSELLCFDLEPMLVTPSNIGRMIDIFSSVVAGGINIALLGNKSGGGIG